MHLCFDGGEPPASLHFTDAGHHDDHHANDAHDDVDVALMDEAAGKAGKCLDLPLLLAAICLLSSLLWLPQQPPFGSRAVSVASDPPRLRPPLRGPPRFASL